jgi:putative FmdB family regulatory protein
MPTYDYVCKNCGYKFDAFQSMKEDLLVECPQCHQPKLQRLISAGAGLLFKGSGFYLTDYKKSSSSPQKIQSQPSEPATETPATKTEPPASPAPDSSKE